MRDFLTLDKRDALMWEEDEVIATKLVVAAVPTVKNDALLEVNEADGRELESVVT